MAIFHLSAKKPIARSAGRSSTAAAAYRAGIEILDHRTGERHDFRNKNGVLETRLFLPDGAEITDRAAFWNGIEAHHKRGDAVLAREVIVALPAELHAAQRLTLAEGFARELADRYGVAVDLALHAPDKNGSQLNWHAHILKTACHVDQAGGLGKKALELDPIHCTRHKLDDAVTWMRPRWAELVNAALEREGLEERVDHRSHVDLGFQSEPTEHVGFGVGREIRNARNGDRRTRNAQLQILDEEMLRALRERAQHAAAEKIAEADRMATALRAAELRQRLAEIEHAAADILASAAAVITAKRRMLPASVVCQAKADLPKALQAARSADLATKALEHQIHATSVFRWLHRRKLSKRLVAAQILAHRLSRETAETRIDAHAPELETVRLQEQQAKLRLQSLNDERVAVIGDLRRIDQATAQPLGANPALYPSTGAKKRPTALSRELPCPTPTSRPKRQLKP